MVHKFNQTLCVYQVEDNQYKCYDGKKTTFRDNVKRYNNDKLLFIQNATDMTNEEYYKQYSKDVKQLYKETKTTVNLYRTSLITDEAVRVFKSLCDITPEPIKDYELDYIFESSGGLRYADPYEGELYSYDVKSYYPSLLVSNSFNFPIKQGILKTITQEEFKQKTYFEYGVYNCYIECDDSLLFVENDNCLYTHFELNYALSCGLDIELLDDTYLSYVGCTVKAPNVFKKYVEMMYAIKDTGNKIAKSLLNVLWGKLCQTKLKRIIIDTDECQLKPGQKIIDSIIDNDGRLVLKVSETEKKTFATDFGRLKVFLTAHGRVKMLKNLQKHGRENIVYVHTDSYISKCELKVPKKIKMGSLVLEGKYTNGVIINKNKKVLN
jgi:hypothetical protein